MILSQKWWIALMFTVVLTGLPIIAAAQAGLPKQIVPENCNQPGGCQNICDIAILAQNVLNYGIFLAVVISSFLFAYAGWNMLTSGGSSEMYAKGKRVFGNVFIGLLLILGGWIVIDTLMRTLMGTNPALPWNRICEAIAPFARSFLA
jgi:hypothetical protein